MFPTGLRRFNKSFDRTQSEGKSYILFFHIGNAVVGYYDAVNQKLRSFQDDAIAILEPRIALIEDIGKRGYSQFVVDGNERTGYKLVHRDEVTVPFLAKDGRNDSRNEDMV